MIITPSSDSETGPPTLVNISLDLQIIICALLHPSDILALRETCKTLQLLTRQRTVWVAALHRVCLDNFLFLPSFPILDMSDVELERAAIAPHRWINLCAASAKQHPNNSGAKLRPRTTRIIKISLTAIDHAELFIVPGGRYMVNNSCNGIFVWDLGYTSGADCRLIASVELEAGQGVYYCRVQATPDGMGLVIFYFRQNKECSVYEIYPRSEAPQLTRIAHHDFDPSIMMNPDALLLPDRVLWYRSNSDSIMFRVWDYRMNHSISFVGDVDFSKVGFSYKVMATKTAVILTCFEEILVWAIPPLLPQPLDSFPNPARRRLLPRIPVLFSIAYPDGIVRYPSDFVASQPMSQLYFGPSQPLYFHILCVDSRLHRFEIIVKPNLIDTSLHLINTQPVPHDFSIAFQRHTICEDSVVSCSTMYHWGQLEVYTLSPCTTAISSDSPTKVLLPLPLTQVGGTRGHLCPASGRYVHLDRNICGIVVVDLF